MSSQPPAKSSSKRDRLHPRNLISSLSRHRSRSPSTSNSTIASVTIPTVNASSLPPSNNVSTVQSSSAPTSTKPDIADILTHALQKLSNSERETLQPFITSAPHDIDLAIEGCLTAAKQKRKDLEAKRWVFTFAGRTYTPKEEVDKIVRWLDRYKSIGDIAVNADPIHAGLPWAGLRLLLQIALSDHRQIEALLVGCETALYTINRLKVYLDFLTQLPKSPSQTNFRTALIDMYNQLFSFLAKAITIYQQSTARRVLTSIWREDDITTFEQTCDRLADRLEIEASNCDRTLAGNDREVLRLLRQDMSTSLTDIQRIRSVQAALRRIERKIDRTRLRVVEGAIFNAYGQIHSPCHKATRVDLLQSIYDWAQQPKSKSIFWLSGAAGTGKSTISWTVAQHLVDEGCHGIIDIAGSFFFKRGGGDRGNARSLFPTIAYQLAMKLHEIDLLVAEALDVDPSICSKSLSEQFDKLIRTPLQKLNIKPDHPTYIIVIDALDECEAPDIATVLQLWSELPTFTQIRLRLFLTSRPDLPVLHGFDDISVSTHLDVDLQEATRLSTRNDLAHFLHDNFTDIRNKYNRRPLLGSSLGPIWPGETIISELVDMAYPLFIVAKTVCLFVSDSRWDPTERLASILRARNTGQLSQMAQIYLPVLEHLTTSCSDPSDKAKLCNEFRSIFGAIICLAEPLSIAALATLLDVPERSVACRLEPLRSVLEVPLDVETSVRTLHLSFGEFLTSADLQGQPFGVNSLTTHGALLESCLKLLSSPRPVGLHEDLCDLRQPGYLRWQIGPGVVKNRFSPAIQYACLYWVHHFLLNEAMLEDEGEVHVFLRTHFLHWLEALSLLGRLADAVDHIRKLKSKVPPVNSTNISSFLEDARRFTLTFRAVGDMAPLQIYSSVTTFSPQKSLVRAVCGNMPAWISQSPMTPEQWSQELQRVEGHIWPVVCAAFSPSGSLIASTSTENLIQVWSTETGQEIQKFKPPPEYMYWNTMKIPQLEIPGMDIQQWMSFSTDGALLAMVAVKHIHHSRLNRLSIHIWNMSTGQRVKHITRFFDYSPAASYSLSGVLFAYNPDMDRLVVENVYTGQELHRFHLPQAERRDSDESTVSIKIRTIVFSPDHSLLAASFDDGTIQIWRTDTGQVSQKLFAEAADMKISANNLLLALMRRPNFRNHKSGSVHLWDLSTGQRIKELELDCSIQTFQFSPDSLSLCLGLTEGTLRIIDTHTHQELHRLTGDVCEVTKAVFSPDGSFLASVDGDLKMRLWDMSAVDSVSKQIAAEMGPIISIAYSPDGFLAGSASSAGLVQVWCSSTGRVLRKTVAHDIRIYDMAFSPDCSLLAWNSLDETVQMWSFDKDPDPQTYFVADFTVGGTNSSYFREPPAKCVLFSPNGKLLISLVNSSEGSIVRVWCVATGKMTQRVVFVAAISELAFTPDSSTLVTEHGYIPINITCESMVSDLEGVGVDMQDILTDVGAKSDLRITNDWLKYKDEMLLWLPREYRAAKIAQHGSKFAFGLLNGRVEFLSIGHPYS